MNNSPEVCERSFIFTKKVGGPAVSTGVVRHSCGELEFTGEEFQVTHNGKNHSSPHLLPLCQNLERSGYGFPQGLPAAVQQSLPWLLTNESMTGALQPMTSEALGLSSPNTKTKAECYSAALAAQQGKAVIALQLCRRGGTS